MPEVGELFRRVALERRKVVARTTVSLEAAMSIDRGFEPFMADQLIMRMDGEVLTERLLSDEATVTFRYDVPASWWQMLKVQTYERDPLIRLICRRWPPRYKHNTAERTARFTRYAMFPHSTLRVPALGPAVVVEQIETGPQQWRQ